MSIKTDVASLEVLAKVHQSENLIETFEDMVHTLQTKVSYFDWVGIYMLEGDESILKAASDMKSDMDWEANSELRIPIETATEQPLGKIVVKSRQLICFDQTDITTLQTLAAEISKRLSVN